ncbi:hypothetical protein ACH5RR_032843 [Cinchona calisaya]|uniref:Uncharacterized protein n=1 Tax=Cinchona calisaya TaxID=153742 RepID=A0ABD2YLB1_9GENT
MPPKLDLSTVNFRAASTTVRTWRKRMQKQFSQGLELFGKAASKMILAGYWILVHEANPDYKGVWHVALAQKDHCGAGEIHILGGKWLKISRLQLWHFTGTKVIECP